MLIDFNSKPLTGTIQAPPSKSMYHRELIVRFLSGCKDDYDSDSYEMPDGSGIVPDSDDVIATKACLRALAEGTDIFECKESGSTIRFMIPVAVAYKSKAVDTDAILNRGGVDNHTLVFKTEGRLFDRPLDELANALKPHGVNIGYNSENRTVLVDGKMIPGRYIIAGNVSSQYISGLLMALSYFDEPSSIEVTGGVKSAKYIELTLDVLKKYGKKIVLEGDTYYVNCEYSKAGDNQEKMSVEGDWSNGAFLLCLSLFTDIEVMGLNYESHQGDKAILDFLEVVKKYDSKKSDQSNDGNAAPKKAEAVNLLNPEKTDVALLEDELRNEIIWNAADIPDIVPYMAVVAAFKLPKTTFTEVGRLRIKESDRIRAIREQLAAIGVRTEETEDTLTIYPIGSEAAYRNVISEKETPVFLSSYHDHRMAMSAILIAAATKRGVELDDIECMNKSYPGFRNYLDKE